VCLEVMAFFFFFFFVVWLVGANISEKHDAFKLYFEVEGRTFFKTLFIYQESYGITTQNTVV
jgi:hypothetical protein